MVATTIIWLKTGFFRRLLLPKPVFTVCLENQIFETQLAFRIYCPIIRKFDFGVISRDTHRRKGNDRIYPQR